MLGELKDVSQHEDAPGKRRWFADEEMDLIVWYSKTGEIIGFELCYDKGGDEHALTWRKGGRLGHSAVDQGDALPTDNRTPILTSGGKVPLERVLSEFTARSADLEPNIARLVLEELHSFGR